jgi:hypothetical protein
MLTVTVVSSGSGATGWTVISVPSADRETLASMTPESANSFTDCPFTVVEASGSEKVA